MGGTKLPTIIGVKIVGKKLQRLRTKKLLSRKELADKTGLHPDHIGRLEKSEGRPYKPPRFKNPRLYQGPGTGAELLRQLELCHRLYNKALWRRRGKYKFEVSAHMIVGHLQRSPNTLTQSAI